MSSDPQSASDGTPMPPSAASQNPDCPECRRVMTVKQVSPVLLASAFDDVIYGCDRCGTEAQRTVPRA